MNILLHWDHKKPKGLKEILEEDSKWYSNKFQIKKKNLKKILISSHRGQTQSQYLSFGGGSDPNGKAEAESTHLGSRAIVGQLFGIKKKILSFC